jgi:hypothetical protein
MTKFKKFRIGLWYVLLIISGVIFIYSYGEGIAPLFYGSILSMIIFQTAVRLEYH